MTKPRDPKEEFEPEVLRQMKIQPLLLPDASAFMPRFTEEELENVAEADMPSLRGINKLDQKLAWVMGALMEMNGQMMIMEADAIKSRINSGANRMIKLGSALLMVFASGIVMALAKSWADKFWK